MTDKLARIEARAHELMLQHGLKSPITVTGRLSLNGGPLGPSIPITFREGWTFHWDEAKTLHGRCYHRSKRITLSRPIALLNTEEAAEDTLLHEIAHALAGPKAHHGPAWKAVARSIGCTATRCAPATAARVPAPWEATCECGKKFKRHRRSSRKMWCSACVRANGGKMLDHLALQYERVA